MSPELMLLLLCAQDKNEEKEEIVGLLNQSVNWDLFLQLARYHRLFPLAYKTLSSIDNPGVPENVTKELRQEYRKNVLKAVGMTGEMVRIMRLFKENGIKSLVLKGAPLAQKLYGDVALRPSKDIDLMVGLEDLEKAGKILEKEGYKNTQFDVLMTPRQKKDYLDKFHHFNYYHAERRVCLELHWKMHKIDLKYQALSNSDVRKVDIAGYAVPVMADEEWFMYLMVHGSSHKWFRLRWLCDLERLMRQGRDMDWGKLIFLADYAGLRTIMHQTMILANELLQVPVPDPMTQSLRHDKKAWVLANLVINQLYDQEDNAPSSSYWKNFILRNGYHLRLRSGWQHKLSYLFSLLQPMSRDFRLISLPDRLYPLYYLIRPMTWLGRRLSSFSRRTMR
ncbi:MAG: nucleotidyltransferase family protein [Dehalobacterium sp.]